MSKRSPRHLFHDKFSHYPLVDGVFAIAMTLLSLEFPDIFLNSIFLNPSLPSVFRKLCITLLLICQYIIIFLVLYEMWSFHKSIFKACESSKSPNENIITILLLASIAFIPAGTTIIIREIIHRGELVFASGSTVAYPHFNPHSLYIIEVISFVLLGILAKTATVYRQRSRLQVISKQSFTRASFFLFLTACSVLLSGRPPTLTLLLIFPTGPLLFYLYYYVFNSRLLVRNICPTRQGRRSYL